MEDQLRFPILLDLGFSLNEAKIYEILLSGGTTKAVDLAKKSGLGRANVYAILEQLKAKHLILPIEGRVDRFQAVDPARLADMVRERKDEVERLDGRFRSDLPSLASAFSLSTGKPVIQLFEGYDGFISALEDSLTSKTEILTFVDISALTGKIAEINASYVKKRIAKDVRKRIIVTDTPGTRAFFNKFDEAYTSVAFIKNFPARFDTALEMYDGTLSFLTLATERQRAVVIKDQNMYDLERQKFDFIWSAATEIKGYAARRNETTGAGSKTA